MPAASETLPALESCLAERLLDFDFLDEVWPRGRTAIERAGIGLQREDALSGIVALRDRIVTARAETLVDAAVQLRRLAVEAETEALSLRGLLAGPDMRGLVGYDGFWLARFLDQRGIECLVMEPASLQVRMGDRCARLTFEQ